MEEKKKFREKRGKRKKKRTKIKEKGSKKHVKKFHLQPQLENF